MDVALQRPPSDRRAERAVGAWAAPAGPRAPGGRGRRHRGDRAGAHRGLRERRPARGASTRTTRSTVAIDDVRCRICVADTAAASTPPACPPSADSLLEGGRGLLLMRALVDRLDFVSSTPTAATGSPWRRRSARTRPSPRADLRRAGHQPRRSTAQLSTTSSPSTTYIRSCSAHGRVDVRRAARARGRRSTAAPASSVRERRCARRSRTTRRRPGRSGCRGPSRAP